MPSSVSPFSLSLERIMSLIFALTTGVVDDDLRSAVDLSDDEMMVTLCDACSDGGG